MTIQSYTGTDFTNGIPFVMRLNTAGSSSGSFTLKLCNIHATNPYLTFGFPKATFRQMLDERCELIQVDVDGL